MTWAELTAKPIRILKMISRDGRRRYTVNSSTDARRRYIVMLTKDGKWSCSCRGWIFPRKVVVKGKEIRMRKDCRHIRRVKGGAR